MTIEILITVFIFGFALFYLGVPLIYSKEGARSEGGERGQLEELRLKKEEVLSSIKDLELDHRMKKISDKDYQELYQETFQEGTKLLEEIDHAEKNKWKERIEADINKLATEEVVPVSQEIAAVTEKKSHFCHQCGEALVPNSRFCSHCGTKI